MVSTVEIGVAGLAAFTILILLGFSVAGCMALTGFVGYGVLRNFKAASKLLTMDFFSSFNSYNMSVVAMFTLMGYLAYYSGIGSKIFNFANKMVGHWPGGLAMAAQVACGCFSAVCGSTTATAATIGAISLPEMKKYNYNPSLSTASVASGGTLGILFPPSMIAIVYGTATEQSIGKLFLAGIMSGFLVMALFMIAIYVSIKWNPALAPVGRRYSWKERVEAMGGGLFDTFVVFIVSIGGLSLGYFTPTEAGGIGATAMLAVCVIRRKLTLSSFSLSLKATAKTTAMVLYLVAGATIFGRFMALSKIPMVAAQWAASLPWPAWAIFLAILFIYLTVGCFIDALPLILLTVPIFYPVVVKLGYDPIWFGVIIVMVASMGVITPPVGINVYVVKGIASDVPLEVIFKGIWPFLIALCVGCLILMVFPDLVLFLPRLLS